MRGARASGARGAALLSMLLGAGAAAGPVLHEPVQVPRLRCEGGICRRGAADGPAPSAEALPEALALGEGERDGLLRAPRPAAEQVYGPMSPGLPLASGAPAPGSDPPPTRRLRAAPDRSTGAEPPGERLYHEVFNPTVYPFKRMTVLDAVAEDETLYLRDRSLRPVAVEGARLQAGRDPFYGAVTVDLQPGRPVPLPTPAAGIRLLSLQVAPPSPLRFARDGGDGLYVSAAEGGRRQLVFLVDAPQRYFAGPLLPPGAPRPRLRDVPPALRAPLPRPVQRLADRVLRRLELPVRPEDDYQQVLDRLVNYFRDFQMGELRGRSGSTYLDIAFEQRGACRHRAYAFVITALGAGVPARYVENELHVFAEVYVPLPPRGEGGYWRRVHLGGAPLEQRVVGADDKVPYRERGSDPFPQPPRFTAAQPRQVAGLPPGQGGGAGGPGSGGGAGGPGSGGGASDGAAGRGEGASGRGAAGRGDGGRGASGPGDGAAGRGAAGERAAASGPEAAGKAPGSRSSASDVVSVRDDAPSAVRGAPPGASERGAGSGERGAPAPGRGAGATAGGARDGPAVAATGASEGAAAAAAAPSAGSPGRGAATEAAPARSAPAEDDPLAPRDLRPDPPGRPLLPSVVSVAAAAGAPRALYRGAPLRVAGRVQVRGGSAAGLEVHLFLDTPEGALPLGHTVSGEGGAYAAEVEIPREAPLGDHRLIARVRGDADRRGSSSRR